MTVPKIRVWDEELQLMVPDHYISRHRSGDLYEAVSPLTDKSLLIAKLLSPNNVMQSFHVFDNSEDEVEIYEGDIVQFEDYDPQTENTFYSLGIVERKIRLMFTTFCVTNFQTDLIKELF